MVARCVDSDDLLRRALAPAPPQFDDGHVETRVLEPSESTALRAARKGADATRAMADTPTVVANAGAQDMNSVRAPAAGGLPRGRIGRASARRSGSVQFLHG